MEQSFDGKSVVSLVEILMKSETSYRLKFSSSFPFMLSRFT